MTSIFFAFPYDLDRKHVGYRDTLRRAAIEQNLQPVFADEVHNPDHILSNIVTQIAECAAGFYDLTGMNRNVLIEYGIGTGLGKPSFILYQRPLFDNAPEPEVPSDLSGQRRHEYWSLEQLQLAVGGAIDATVLPPIREHQNLRERVMAHIRRVGRVTKADVMTALGIEFSRSEDILDSLHREGFLTRFLVDRHYEFEPLPA